MTIFTTQLLTDETKQIILDWDNDALVGFCNDEEAVYLEAMSNQSIDRRPALIEAFNESVISFSMNYPDYK